MNNKCVSVIVPIYNVEKYLIKCVESIKNQTYKNLEILLIDDGSKDKSGDLAEQLAATDERIKVYHKLNGGLSSARNKGLEVCTGDYVCFVDSDDYIKDHYVEELLGACIKNESDIAICYYFSVKDDVEIFDRIENHNDGMIEVITGKQACLRYLETPFIVAWNKLYKRNLFDEVRFPEGKLHEDVATTYKCYWSAKKVSVVNKGLYGYRVNETGIMRTKYSTRRYDELSAIKDAIAFFDKLKEEEIVRCFYWLYFDRVILHMWYAADDFELKHSYYEKLKAEAKEKLNLYKERYGRSKKTKKFEIGLYKPSLYFMIGDIKQKVKNVIKQF